MASDMVLGVDIVAALLTTVYLVRLLLVSQDIGAAGCLAQLFGAAGFSVEKRSLIHQHVRRR